MGSPDQEIKTDSSVRNAAGSYTPRNKITQTDRETDRSFIEKHFITRRMVTNMPRLRPDLLYYFYFSWDTEDSVSSHMYVKVTLYSDNHNRAVWSMYIVYFRKIFDEKSAYLLYNYILQKR
jgi:hypothetical protein